METLVLNFLSIEELFRSYPTYEEWKLPPPFQFVLSFQRSYPTYEEWKLCKCYRK